MEKIKAPDDLLKDIDNFSKGRLKQKEDIKRLIEISLSGGNSELFEETAFIAKYLQGLFDIIQRGDAAVDEEVLNKYVKEYTENTEKVKTNLKSLLQDTTAFYKNIFEDKYFSLTQEAIGNLNDLCYDLSWIKMYLNDKKIKLK